MLAPQTPAPQGYSPQVPTAGYDAPTMWAMPTPTPQTTQMPAPMPTLAQMHIPPQMPMATQAPKRKGGLIALVLAIVLVAVVATGAVLLLKKGGAGGADGLKVTGTAPAYTEDWTKGVTQSWSQTFNNDQSAMYYNSGVLAMSSDGWVVADGTSVDGVDPATGQVRWRHDFGDGFSSGCTDTVFSGKVACFGGGFTGQLDNAGQLCLIDIQTGDPTCIDMGSIVVLPPGNTGYWTSLWFADGALIVAGNADANDSPKPYWEVARLSLPSLSVQWANTYNDNCDMGTQSNEPNPSQLGNGGITGDVLWFSDSYDEGPPVLAIDIRDGQRVLPQDKCATIYALTNDTFVAPPEIPAGPLTLPGGGQITIVNSGSAIEYANGQLPSLPISMDGNGALSVGGTAWGVTLPLQTAIDMGPTFLAGAASGNTLVVAAGLGQITAFDYTAGKPLWSANAPISDFGYDMYSNLYVSMVGNVVAVTSSGLENGDKTTLLSLATGQQIAQMPGDAVVSSDGTMLAVVNQTASGATVTRYVPSSESWQTPPTDAPACPAGMTPVTWTKYSDGSVLICSGNGTYDVISSQGWTARQIDWTDGGYTVTFTNGNVLNAYLGGSSVTVTAGGNATQYVADESWTIATGTADFTDTPTGIPSCPSNTYPISLSIWNGGWLLVCGTDASTPTSMAYSDGGTQGQGSSVTTVPGGYCADGPSGKVCTYQSPAVVSIGDTQHSVDNNYFSGAGGGGAGQGTGSYGVPAPDATAQAQVQYLVDILNSSAATRSSLGPPSVDVQQCQNLPSAIAQIQVVAQNRQDLMTALNSTPVDHIPNGSQLVSQLQAALQASYDADMAYADWGQQQQTNCAVLPPQAVTDTNNTASATKDAFCNTWNTQIAPTYGVPGFTPSQI